jgi:hypothetical protein
MGKPVTAQGRDLTHALANINASIGVRLLKITLKEPNR